MHGKQYILMINRNGEGAVMPFPRLLELPPTKMLGDLTYVKTDRTKTFPDYKATIYVQANTALDLDQYADPIIEEPVVENEQDPTQSAQPTVDSTPAPVGSATPTGPVTRIYGTSDDLIEIDGGYTGEVGGGEDKRLVIVSDGTLLEISYGKGEQGIWAITVLKKGTAYAGFEPGDDEDADIYSDIVTLRGDIKYVYVASEYEKAQ